VHHAEGLMHRAHAYQAAVADAEAQGKADVDAGVNMGVCYRHPGVLGWRRAGARRGRPGKA
jgi:hypothetical protein